jgi:hypothetical protein
MVVCVVSMWGVGLGGGWLLTVAGEPAALGAAALHGSRSGALGFWLAGVIGLVVASAGLALVIRRVWRMPAA